MTSRRPRMLLGGLALLAATILTVVHTTSWPLDYFLPVLLLDDVLRDTGAVVLLLTAFLSVGRRLLALFRSTEDDPGIATAVGVLAYALVGTALGLVDLLHGWLLLTLVIAGALCDVRGVVEVVQGLLRRARAPMDNVTGALTALVVMILGLLFVQNLGPSGGPDDLIYHVNTGWRYLQAHSLDLSPETKAFHGTQYNQVIYAWLLALPGSSNSPRLLNLAFLLLTLDGVSTFARRFFPRMRPALVHLVLLAQPVVLYVAVRPYGDLTISWMTLLSVMLAAQAVREDRRDFLVLSALLMGLGAGIKITVFLVFGALGLSLAAALLWRRGPRARVLLDLALFGCLAVAVTLPWNLWMWLNLSTPFDPIFIGADWVSPPEYILPTTFQDETFAQLRYPATLQSLVSLPWRVTFSSEPPNGFWGNRITPIFLCLLPVSLLISRRRGLRRFLLAVLAIFVAIWSTKLSFIRYLLPVLPLAALLCVDVLEDIEQYLGRRTRMGLTGLLVFLPALLGGTRLLVEPATSASLRYTAGLLDQQEYYDAVGSEYARLFEVITWANEHLDPASTRVRLFWEARSQHLLMPHVPDITSHSDLYELQKLSGGTDQGFLHELQSRGFTHVLYNAGAYQELFGSPEAIYGRSPEVFAMARDSHLAFEGFAAQHLELLYEAEGVRLYAVREDPP